MQRTEILGILTDVFRQVFHNDGLQIDESMNSASVERWDSLHHINLIVAIESEFGIKFRSSEIEKLVNVGTIVDLVARKAA